MKFKKIFIVALICLLTCTLCFCTKKENEEIKAKSFINATEKVLIIGDEVSFYINSVDYLDYEIKWKSSDESIFTVDRNGLVTANRLGVAKLTATAENGDISECKIEVIDNNMLPALETECYIGDEIQISITEEFNLTTFIKFNSKIFTDAAISFSVENKSIAEINDITLNPKAIGETKVTITAKWRDLDSHLLTKTFVLKVID